MRGGQASSKSRAKNLVSKLIDPLGLGQWGMEREGACYSWNIRDLFYRAEHSEMEQVDAISS